MEYERENRDVIFNIGSMGRTLMVANPLITAPIMLTWTFLKRMVNEQKMKPGEVTNFEKFTAETDGKYDLINVPVSTDGLRGGELDKLKKELDTLNIRYSVLPDLNKEDGLITVALKTSDKGKFSAWYEQHILSNMHGGEKSRLDLEHLTNNQVSIVSIPLERKMNDNSAMREMLADFDKLGINYSRLPKLNVESNDLQLVVANADLQKVKHWFDLHKNSLIKEGKDVGGLDMSIVSSDAYMGSGTSTAEQYINNADPDLKQANEKYMKEPGELEKAVLNQSNGIMPETNPEYEKFFNDPNYTQITIDKATLIDNSSYGASELALRYDHFACRVPGTYGKTEQTLIIPNKQVFVMERGDQTAYAAFLEKEKRAYVLGPDGKPLPIDTRLSGMEFRNKYFDQIEENFSSLAKSMKGPDLNKGDKVPVVVPKLTTNIKI